MNTPKRDPFFIQFLLYSIVLHGCTFFVISQDMDFISLLPKKSIQIQQALRVDTIGLPDLQKQISSPTPTKKKTPVVRVNKKKKPSRKPVKTQKVTKKKKPETKSKPTPQVQKNYTNRQNQAIDKLKALEQIKQMEREEEEKEYIGQQISKGNSTQGEKIEDFTMVQYFTSVRVHINMYWSLPMELANQDLRAQIHTQISNTGKVLKRTIMQSSGNEEFDARVLETIDRASPFPQPPDSVKASISNGIVFQFPE